jgi:hypothetical protein
VTTSIFSRPLASATVRSSKAIMRSSSAFGRVKSGSTFFIPLRDLTHRLRSYEVARLRKAVSDLTLDKLILKEAAKGNF